MPTWVNFWSSNSQICRPFSSATRGARSCRCAGRRPSKVCGGSTTWSSTEITVYFTSRGRGSGRNSSSVATDSADSIVSVMCGLSSDVLPAALGCRSARPFDALDVEPDGQEVLHVERVCGHCRTHQVVVDLEAHALVLLREPLALIEDRV